MQTWQPSDDTFKVVRTRRIPKVIDGAQYWQKGSHILNRIALERHAFSATRAERLQNAKHWILRLNADGPQKPLRQRPKFAVASKQCLKNARRSLGGNATISETDTSRTSTTSTRRSTIRRRRKLRLLSRSENWMAVLHRATGENRRQRLHLQHRSGKTHSGKRVGAHRIPHHLINGGDFGFLEGIPENRLGVQTGHPLTRHICVVQFVHSAHRTIDADAQEMHCHLRV